MKSAKQRRHLLHAGEAKAAGYCATVTGNAHGLSVADLPFRHGKLDETKFLLGADGVKGLRADFEACMDEVAG